MRSNSKINARLIVFSLLLSGEMAQASTTVTTNLAVSATVNAVCVVNSIGAISFGAYTGTAVTSSATVNYTCSNGLPVSISLDKGANGATTAARLMKNSTSTLGYQLYSDSGYSTVWDDSASKISVTGSGSATTHTIYGQIPAGQYPAIGSYTDTVTINFTY